MEVPFVTDMYRQVVDWILIDVPLFGLVERALVESLDLLHRCGLGWWGAILMLTFILRLAILPIGLRSKRCQFLLIALKPHVAELGDVPKGREREERLFRLYSDNRIQLRWPLLAGVLQFLLFGALVRLLLGESFASDATAGLGIPGVVPDIRLAVGAAGWGGGALLAVYLPLQMLVTHHTAVVLTRRQRYLALALSLAVLPLVVNVPVSLLLIGMAGMAVMIVEHELMTRRMAREQLVLPRDADAPLQVTRLVWGRAGTTDCPARDEAA